MISQSVSQSPICLKFRHLFSVSTHDSARQKSICLFLLVTTVLQRGSFLVETSAVVDRIPVIRLAALPRLECTA